MSSFPLDPHRWSSLERHARAARGKYVAALMNRAFAFVIVELRARFFGRQMTNGLVRVPHSCAESAHDTPRLRGRSRPMKSCDAA